MRRCRGWRGLRRNLLTRKLEDKNIARVDRGPSSEPPLGGQLIADKAVIYPQQPLLIGLVGLYAIY
jgi:hypothetical protein